MKDNIIKKCLDKKLMPDEILALGLLEEKEKAMTVLEIRKFGINVSRSNLRKLLRLGFVTRSAHYQKNSLKEFKHKNGNTEKIKGTKVYKYKFRNLA